MMKLFLLCLLPCFLAYSAPLSCVSGDMLVTVHDSGDLNISIGGKPFIQSPAGLPATFGSYATSVPMPARMSLTSADALLKSTADGSVTVDFTPRCSSPCQQLTRTVSVKTPHAVTITDTAAFSRLADFGTALIASNNTIVQKIDDNTYIIANGSKALRLVLSGPEANCFTLLEKLRPSSARRIGINCIRPVRNAAITITVTPFDSRKLLPPLVCGPAADYDLNQAITVEAEAFTAQKGGAVKCQIRPAASGMAFMNWDNKGHSLTWEVNLPQQGRYAILVRCAHPDVNGAARSVVIDSQTVLFPASAPIIFPETGGWSGKTDNWQNYWLASAKDAVAITLSAGKHTITMVNQDGHGLNLDWIKFVPLQ